MSEVSAYPRVLILAANPINRVQSNGLLMRSLFRGWPKDRLAQIYFPLFHPFPPDGTVCGRYLKVNAWGFASEFRPPAHRAVLAGQTRNESRITGIVQGLVRRPGLRTLAIDPLRETSLLFPWLRPGLLRFAQSFKPDLLYTLLGTLTITRLTAMLAKELRRPIIPHVTDNWIDTRFSGSWFEKPLRKSLFYWFEQVNQLSPVMLVMSGTMGEEYRRRYRKKCSVFTTGVSAANYTPLSPAIDPSKPLRLIYAGSLGLERWRILQRLAVCLKQLRSEGIAAVLRIYCSSHETDRHRSALEIPGVAEMAGWVPFSKLPNVFAGADLLVHVESSDPSAVDYTKYSFSTKLSQYMMTGRCLVLVGPPEAGSMKEIRRLGAGVVIDVEKPGETARELGRLLKDEPYRLRMGEKARRLAIEHFEERAQRERFRRVLAEAALAVPGDRVS